METRHTESKTLLHCCVCCGSPASLLSRARPLQVSTQSAERALLEQLGLEASELGELQHCASESGLVVGAPVGGFRTVQGEACGSLWEGRAGSGVVESWEFGDCLLQESCRLEFQANVGASGE